MIANVICSGHGVGAIHEKSLAVAFNQGRHNLPCRDILQAVSNLAFIIGRGNYINQANGLPGTRHVRVIA